MFWCGGKLAIILMIVYSIVSCRAGVVKSRRIRYAHLRDKLANTSRGGGIGIRVRLRTVSLLWVVGSTPTRGIIINYLVW